VSGSGTGGLRTFRGGCIIVRGNCNSEDQRWNRFFSVAGGPQALRSTERATRVALHREAVSQRPCRPDAWPASSMALMMAHDQRRVQTPSRCGRKWTS
jgi:hypothetical protein